MRTTCLAALCLWLGTALLHAADPAPGKQVEQSFEKDGVKTGYLLYLPKDYEKQADAKAWPLMLFLHGAGERGSDINLVTIHGPPKLVSKEQQDLPFVIVSPQCPKDQRWNPEILMGLVDDVLGKYRTDPARVYVTGLSMGGYGTWTLAAKYPDRFAALIPICGGGDPATVEKFKQIPVWVFHGAKDTGVPLSKSQEMVNALKATGAEPKFTVYPDAGHDSWTETYKNPDVYKWLLEQRRK